MHFKVHARITNASADAATIRINATENSKAFLFFSIDQIDFFFFAKVRFSCFNFCEASLCCGMQFRRFFSVAVAVVVVNCHKFELRLYILALFPFHSYTFALLVAQFQFPIIIIMLIAYNGMPWILWYTFDMSRSRLLHNVVWTYCVLTQ